MSLTDGAQSSEQTEIGAADVEIDDAGNECPECSQLGDIYQTSHCGDQSKQAVEEHRIGSVRSPKVRRKIYKRNRDHVEHDADVLRVFCC